MCCNTVECRGSKLYCNTVYWVAVYCNTLHCIVDGRAAGGQVVSQYNLEYRGMRQGCLCRKTGSRVVIQQAGRWGAHAWALGRAGVGAGALGRQAHRRGRWGAQGGRLAGVGADGSASERARARQASSSWAQAQAGGSGARGVLQRAAWAHELAKTVHSVHSAWFSTWFFDSVFFLSH